MMDTLELVLDETLLNDEPDCQGKHLVTPCTHHVTHSARDCRDRLNVCDNLANVIRQKMACSVVCAGCFKFAADCWTVTPI